MDNRGKQKFTEEQELRNHNAIVLLLVMLMQVLKLDRNALIEIAEGLR